METEEVTQPGAPPLEVPEKDKGGKKDDTVTLTKAEVEALRREVKEAKDSERYWAERARNNNPAPPEDDEPEEPAKTGNEDVDEAIFNDPDKWTDAISRGPKAIEQFLRKSGYVTAEEAAKIAAKTAKETVRVERQKMSTDAQILNEFPDLKDESSELFKATSAELKAMVKLDPAFAKSPAGLYAAARAAKAGLKAKPAPPPPDDDYDRYEGESDRRRRAASQDTTVNRGRAEAEDDDVLGPEALQLMAAMGISKDEFIASRKQVGRRGRR